MNLKKCILPVTRAVGYGLVYSDNMPQQYITLSLKPLCPQASFTHSHSSMSRPIILGSWFWGRLAREEAESGV